MGDFNESKNQTVGFNEVKNRTFTVADRIGHVVLPPPKFVHSLIHDTVITRADNLPRHQEDMGPVGSGGSGGVSNPYGTFIGAYEPGTAIYEPPPDIEPGNEDSGDNPLLAGYAEAYAAVQASKMGEAGTGLSPAEPGAIQSSSGQVSGVPYSDVFNSAAAKYGISAALLAAVARAESNFNPSAVSPAGAQGLMQFMPGTAAGLGVNPWDVRSAIDGAARYLRQQLDRFGSINLALAAYNAGPGNVARYGGVPPFAETQAYVSRVTGYMDGYGGAGTRALVSAPVNRPLLNSPGSGTVSNIINSAKSLLGKPYVWGGTTSSGVDCSGLIYYAFNRAGVQMPRLRAVDYGVLGHAVSAAEARPGDIVYWDNPNTTTDHVGIYLGNGQVIQAPTSGDVVKISQVWGNPTYRRLVDDPSFAKGPTPSGGVQTIYNGRPVSVAFDSSYTMAPFGVRVASPVKLSNTTRSLIVGGSGGA